MSNTRKDGDFNLDEELRSKIVADSDGQPISDDHEDAKGDDDELTLEEELSEENSHSHKLEAKKYHINPRLKRRKELLNSDVILSLVHAMTSAQTTVEIDYKAFVNYDLDITESQAKTATALLVILMPAIAIAVGSVIIFRRKRR